MGYNECYVTLFTELTSTFIAPHRQKLLGYIVVHGLPAKRVICPRVLHVIGASESVLVPHFFGIPPGTRVPVFRIEPAQETYVLIGMYLHDIQKVGIALTGRRLKPCRDVGDDMCAANGRILDLGRWHLSMRTVSVSITTTTATASPSTMGRIIQLLLLETMERGWGINLGRRTGDRGRVVTRCATGCVSGPWNIHVSGGHHHLLHQQLLLLVELCIDRGELL